MHLLHLSSAKTWRGGEQQIAYLIEELLVLGVPQIVFCVQNAPLAAWCQAQEIPYFVYKKRASIDLKVARQIKKITDQENITHLHAHDSHAHTFAFLSTLLFKMKKPIIISRRVDFSIKNNFFSHWKYNHRSIRKIICISHNIKHVIERDIKDQSRLQVVHSGIRPEKLSTTKGVKNSLREEYHIPNNKKIIANIAALADHKDYPTFVCTAEVLLKKRTDLQFFIIGGDAGERANICRLVKEKKLTQQIIFTGFWKDIRSIFPELDILLFTSKEEGLGTTVLDAFASEVPVVATKAGGIPEMVIHQKTGWLASIGDAQELARGVEQILSHPLFRDSLVENANVHLQQFTSKKMADAILGIYNTVT